MTRRTDVLSVSTTMDDVEKINQWVNKEKKKKIPANSDTEQTNISLKREATMYNNDKTCLVKISYWSSCFVYICYCIHCFTTVIHCLF